jgi:hypothetical protein
MGERHLTISAKYYPSPHPSTTMIRNEEQNLLFNATADQILAMEPPPLPNDILARVIARRRMGDRIVLPVEFIEDLANSARTADGPVRTPSLPSGDSDNS